MLFASANKALLEERMATLLKKELSIQEACRELAAYGKTIREPDPEKPNVYHKLPEMVQRFGQLHLIDRLTNEHPDMLEWKKQCIETSERYQKALRVKQEELAGKLDIHPNGIYMWRPNVFFEIREVPMIA